jgi:hypothetical protein
VSDDVVRRFKAEHAALGRTYLGLPDSCASCHEADDPHGTQFPGRTCADCHDQRDWDEAPGFDHDEARFRLTGRHRPLECASCHAGPAGASDGVGGALRYRPLAFASCTACHEDEHDGAMAGDCTTCHATEGWLPVVAARVAGRFDHGTTAFPLTGAHAAAECASCHDRERVTGDASVRIVFREGTESRAFPSPMSGTCAACHVDEHRGVFDQRPDDGGCTGCHDEDAWLPSSFDLERHNVEASFLLEGAHVVVPCASCHREDGGPLLIRVEAGSCGACHTGDDPHGEQFAGRDCARCHGPDSFRIPAFAHEATAFPLEGAHRELACTSCHVAEGGPGASAPVRYRPLGTACQDCHGGRR